MSKVSPRRDERDGTAPGRLWFEQGCLAFKRSFPDIAKDVPRDLFYVCPLCLVAFDEEALAVRFLTREHVPPESVGGRRMVLTCGTCNWGSGRHLDPHARREADIVGFATGNLQNLKAELSTPSGRVPVRLSVSGKNVQMFGVPKAASPSSHANVFRDVASATDEGKWQGFTLKVHFAPYSHRRAAVSWLRTAYLALFAALGYRFIFRPELDVVRAKIKDPAREEPRTFRIIRREQEAEPTLFHIREPEVFSSFAMFHGPNVVLLPRYNDRVFFERIAQHPDTAVELSGIQYPWPSGGPTFLHDNK
jgi:hypothetical protein